MIRSFHIWDGANNQERGQPSSASWMRVSECWSKQRASSIMSSKPFARTAHLLKSSSSERDKRRVYEPAHLLKRGQGPSLLGG